jgi:hypothetical protein
VKRSGVSEKLGRWRLWMWRGAESRIAAAT